jgi:hypothetical protein
MRAAAADRGDEAPGRGERERLHRDHAGEPRRGRRRRAPRLREPRDEQRPGGEAPAAGRIAEDHADHGDRARLQRGDEEDRAARPGRRGGQPRARRAFERRRDLERGEADRDPDRERNDAAPSAGAQRAEESGDQREERDDADPASERAEVRAPAQRRLDPADARLPVEGVDPERAPARDRGSAGDPGHRDRAGRPHPGSGEQRDGERRADRNRRAA